MIKSQTLVALGFFAISTILGVCNCKPVGFSYSKFSGPVSGPEKEVYRKDQHGHTYVDYVQKPDYSFAYGVDDPKTRVLQNRKETRHGDAVKGEYSVVDPDGTLRVVKYTADKKNGFQAEVITDGVSQMHGAEVAPTTQHHNAQYHPAVPTQHHPQPHPQSHEDHEYYNHQQHHEEPEITYHQKNDAPSTAAYTSHTRHPAPVHPVHPVHPVVNAQYHQNGYSGEENEGNYDDAEQSGEEDDGSGEDDDEESGEEDDEEGDY